MYSADSGILRVLDVNASGTIEVRRTFTLFE